MELTVGYLKKTFAQLSDDVIIAHLEYGNRDFVPHLGIKRLLLLKDESGNQNWGGYTFLTINPMGSHFTGEGRQENLKCIGHFDEDSFKNDEPNDQSMAIAISAILDKELPADGEINGAREQQRIRLHKYITELLLTPKNERWQQNLKDTQK